MAIPPEFLEDLKARLTLPDLVGRKVRLVRSGRDLKGCCPFHKEKTPSFHVYDDHYHCFGCGAHGSAIDFVMETENLAFPEAVERLAAEAGLAMPHQTPEERAREKQVRERRKSLAEVVEAAAAFFEKCLRMPEGRAALDYLKGRGLSEETIRRFRLGYAPDGKGALKSALARDGVEEAMMIEAGLLVKPDDDSRAPYDRFRDRVTFPITDRQGRVIAFGARLLSGDGPKYLNSPETPLFHKGRNLYGLAQARDAIRGAGTVIVAEGYMDVIALAEAGIGHAVAPLGTAVTEEQIEMLWRLAPEPVMCLDGDEAGRRAAARAADRALPLLKSGYGLRFALLPAGEDPDSLVRARGPQAFREVLDDALPLSELIWRFETGDRVPASPEARAALEKKLKDRVRQIGDPTLRSHFANTFRERLWPDRGRDGGRERPRRPGAGKRWEAPWTGIAPLRRGSAEVARLDSDGLRGAILLAVAVNHPALLDEVCEQLGSLTIADGELDNLRQAILISHADGSVGDKGLDSEALRNHLFDQGYSQALDRVLSARTYSHAYFARPEAGIAEARRGWEATINHLRGEDLESELQAAQDAVRREPSEENINWVVRVRRMIEEAEQTAAGLE